MNSHYERILRIREKQKAEMGARKKSTLKGVCFLGFLIVMVFFAAIGAGVSIQKFFFKEPSLEVTIVPRSVPNQPQTVKPDYKTRINI